MKDLSSVTHKSALLLFSVALLLAVRPSALQGQSALDGFDPNANGIVQVVVVQPDGKVLIGGDFTALAPNGGASVTRNHIARLNADGTLDTTFNPNANGTVYAIAVQADGRILAGGSFTIIGGQPRNFIGRLDPTSGLADAFNPNANSAVASIVVQADGKILAGGAFSGANSIGGQTRNYIARLNPDGSLDAAFNPNANNVVFSIAVQADGKVLAGGYFLGTNSIGGQTRNFIARLDATTGAADTFNPNASGFYVFSIAVQADGRILAGGAFTNIGGQARINIARLDATTGLADSFAPNANAAVLSIVVQPDGKILAGGNFFGIGGQTRNRIARLNPITGLADSFDPNATVFLGVYSMALQADGKILAGGSFAALAPNGGASVPRNNIARLEADGRIDLTLNLGFIGANTVFTTVVQPDGKILIGGNFTTVSGVTRNGIARLNTDGTLDLAFNPNAIPAVYAIAVQADGKILVGGEFAGANSIGGQMRNHIARLNATNGLADSFNPNADYDVHSIVAQADGKILVGGGFTNIAGQTRNRMARLNPDGTLDTAFNPNANQVAIVNTIAVQADGKILVGGYFAIIGGQFRNNIARLNATNGLADSFNPNANNNVHAIVVEADGRILVGGIFNSQQSSSTPSIGGAARNYIARLDPGNGEALSWNPNASNEVRSIVVQADGKILVGGRFLGIGGQPRNRIARLHAETGLDASFNPNANDTVNSIAVQADGKILVGGHFTGANSIGGQTRSFFARLNNDTIARQNLVVTQSTVTWTRGGSSPQFARVVFEDSTDSVNYNFLGHGTATGTNWTLTGLNLSIGQNLFIRARGYYSSGYHNGSESILESVRNAFLTLPPRQPLLNIQRLANTDVVLSWATSFTGFTLEAKTNLTTNVWSVVSPAPSVSGTNNVVTNPASGPARFFRLRQ